MTDISISLSPEEIRRLTAAAVSNERSLADEIRSRVMTRGLFEIRTVDELRGAMKDVFLRAITEEGEDEEEVARFLLYLEAYDDGGTQAG